MPVGKVKWFNDKKGFGFLTTEDLKDKDVFVHYSSIVGDGFKSLSPGDEVKFELIQGPTGLQAQNVSRV
jgi:CspA family cold shock protein